MIRAPRIAETEPWVADLVRSLANSIVCKRMVEIGCWTGSTTEKLLGALCEDGLFYGLDLVEHPDFPHSIKRDPRFVFVGGDSATSVERVPDGIDFCFIDGDHTFPTVLCDFGAMWRKLRVGGILTAHDPLVWPGVKDAANLVCPKHVVIQTYPAGGMIQTGLLIATKEEA